MEQSAFRRVVALAAWGGAWGALLSTLPLLRDGARETGHPAAPVNAISHWLWPRSGLRADPPSWRYSGTGMVIHFASSLFWGVGYALLREYRASRGRQGDGQARAAEVALDASLVAAAAATVDLRVVPHRLSPGFQERLSNASLCRVYAGFALGLAVASWFVERRR